MPNITLYLNEETMEAVKARAASRSMPLSAIVREAIEEYLRKDARRQARQQVIETLKALGGADAWQELHRERRTSDAYRP